MRLFKNQDFDCRLKDGDPDSWVAEWTAAGQRARATAEEAETAGHRISAREAWLRAGTYHSTAAYTIAGCKRRDEFEQVWSEHRDCWDRAAALFEPPAEPVAIEKDVRTQLEFRMRPYGMDSPYDVYEALEDYTLEGVVDGIRCPMLICDPDREHFWPGQPRRVYDALPGPKALARFTQEEGSDWHCEPRSPAIREQRVFDWLDGVLDRSERDSRLG